MVATRETAIAVPTFEWLGARVLAVMARQLVRAGKPPFATLPTAFVRLFPRMRPLVGLKVRALGVHLFASEKLAFVYPAFGIWRAVFVTSHVMPIRNSSRDRSRSRVRVLRTSHCWETVRRY